MLKKSKSISVQVKNNLVTPRNGELLIAANQDFITASYLISRRDQFYDRSQFALLCSYMSDATDHIEIPPPTILKVGLHSSARSRLQ
jgi:DNA-directed RNA polymerase III subunit RPC1